MGRIDVVCFFASYGLALLLELWHLLRPRPVFRLLALGLGTAGLFAQSVYLYRERPPLLWQFGWLLFLAWVLVVFYLCGSVHYRRLAWGVFVLPVVLGLVGLGLIFRRPGSTGEGREPLLGAQGFVASLMYLFQAHRLRVDPWATVHVWLLLLACVGMCVGFVASLMYLFQAHRLRVKAPPGRGVRLLSLERLETMNRRAIVLAFPLLTAGIIAGAVMIARGSELVGWTDPRVLSTAVLWIAFAVLLFLRLGHHLRGRQVALLTIAAFFLLLLCVFISHSHPREGGLP
jgi:ABC-type transport system involved in cytochrome c biogenesis permease subunit